MIKPRLVPTSPDGRILPDACQAEAVILLSAGYTIDVYDWSEKDLTFIFHTRMTFDRKTMKTTQSRTQNIG